MASADRAKKRASDPVNFMGCLSLRRECLKPIVST
jgi:hypothetical protein